MALCCTCFNAFAQNVPDYVPSEGLVAWWPFNGNANDESGNGNHGVIEGAELTSDRFNQSNSAFYVPPGSSVNFGEDQSFAITSEHTVSIGYWFYANNGKQPFLAKYLNSEGWDSNFYVGPQFNGNQIVVTANGSNSFVWPIADGWNHALVIYSGEQSEAELWCNGETVFSGQLNFNVNASSQPFLLHSFTYSGEHPNPDGSADDIGFWNRALTEAEISALYNAELPVPGCTDSTACNFDSEATSDDGSCIPSGCMETDACNYNALAECDGEECDYTCCPGPGCCSVGMFWDYELEQCMNYETCQEDLDGDGVIGINDLMELLSSFGTMCEEPETAEFSCGESMNYHGYDYATVQIGEQCWFAENLRTTSYSDGFAIPGGLSDAEWSNTSAGAMAIYGEGSSECDDNQNTNSCDPDWSDAEYGRLYNWHAVNDSRALCPSGWHVPSDSDWISLELALGMDESEATSDGFRGDVGGLLKSTDGWWLGGPGGTPQEGSNSTGFTGLPGGIKNNNGLSDDAGVYGCWWTSSPSPNGEDAWNRQLYYYTHHIVRDSEGYWTNRNNGLSIRCLKDTE